MNADTTVCSCPHCYEVNEVFYERKLNGKSSDQDFVKCSDCGETFILHVEIYADRFEFRVSKEGA